MLAPEERRGWVLTCASAAVGRAELQRMLEVAPPEARLGLEGAHGAAIRILSGQQAGASGAESAPAAAAAAAAAAPAAGKPLKSKNLRNRAEALAAIAQQQGRSSGAATQPAALTPWERCYKALEAVMAAALLGDRHPARHEASPLFLIGGGRRGYERTAGFLQPTAAPAIDLFEDIERRVAARTPRAAADGPEPTRPSPMQARGPG